MDRNFTVESPTEIASAYQLSHIKGKLLKALFKIGPSKYFLAKLQAENPLLHDNVLVYVKFQIIEGNIPILVGNDIFQPESAKIDM